MNLWVHVSVIRHLTAHNECLDVTSYISTRVTVP